MDFSANTSKQSPRVLVVEDDPDTARSLAVLLGGWGYQAEVTHDGEQAEKAALARRPDAVILDIGLPKKNGLEVARSLRGHFSTELLIIAVTGRSQPLDQVACAAAGIDIHFPKPADPEKIREALARFLEA